MRSPPSEPTLKPQRATPHSSPLSAICGRSAVVIASGQIPPPEHTHRETSPSLPSPDCRSAPLSASVDRLPAADARSDHPQAAPREGAVNGSDGAAAARHGGGGHLHDHGGHAHRLGGGRSDDRLDESLRISKGTPRGCHIHGDVDERVARERQTCSVLPLSVERSHRVRKPAPQQRVRQRASLDQHEPRRS